MLNENYNCETLVLATGKDVLKETLNTSNIVAIDLGMDRVATIAADVDENGSIQQAKSMSQHVNTERYYQSVSLLNTLCQAPPTDFIQGSRSTYNSDELQQYYDSFNTQDAKEYIQLHRSNQEVSRELNRL